METWEGKRVQRSAGHKRHLREVGCCTSIKIRDEQWRSLGAGMQGGVEGGENKEGLWNSAMERVQHMHNKCIKNTGTQHILSKAINVVKHSHNSHRKDRMYCFLCRTDCSKSASERQVWQCPLFWKNLHSLFKDKIMDHGIKRNKECRMMYGSKTSGSHWLAKSYCLKSKRCSASILSVK